MIKHTIKSMLALRGMTESELASAVGLSRQGLNYHTAGRSKKPIDVETAIKICDVLGCTVDDIDWTN